MKTKHFLIVFLICSLPVSGYAQPFQTGEKVINVGLGIGSTLYSGVGYSTGLPPLSASFEYGLKELGPGILGIGGYLGVSTYKWETTLAGSTYGWKYSNIIIGARGNYHYSFVENLDTYAGLLLGYNIVNSSATGEWPLGITGSANASSFAYSVFIGGRYYFTDSFAAMAELGYGVAWLNLGIAYKF